MKIFKTRQFICYFHDVQDSHNPHSCHFYSLFCFLQNNLLINHVTSQVFAQLSLTANKILLRNSQCKSKQIVYLQLERYKNNVRINRDTYLMFSGAKIPRPIINYPLDFTWITARIFNNQHVRKRLCRTEIL